MKPIVNILKILNFFRLLEIMFPFAYLKLHWAIEAEESQ